MTVYEPRKSSLPTGFDEIGIRLSMQRLPNESMADFRARLYLEARDPSGPTEKDFIRTVGRHLSSIPQKVFRIDLVQEDDLVLAPDARVEVTSTYLRAWSDYENDVLDFEIDLNDRTTGYFLGDVFTAFGASTYFSIEVLDTDYAFIRSSHLRMGDSDGLVTGELLLQNRVNQLRKQYIKEIWASQLNICVEEQTAYDELDIEGDYFIDRQNGVLFTKNPAKGFLSYTYRTFPYDLVQGGVRTVPLNDTDMRTILYDTLISDETGEPEYVLLNSKGARIFNTVLAIHPLGWGE